MSDLVRKFGKAVARHPETGWFTLLALGVMGPILKPGFVLTLDMVFTPKLPAPHGISNMYVFYWLLHIVNFVLPGQVIEKLIMFAVLLLCGIGMYRLIDTKSEWPRYFAGIFYTINPFTYERWMAGQYLVLVGYALLPFLLKALVTFCAHPNRETTLRVSLWYSAIALVSVHNLVLGAIMGTIVFVTYLLAHSPKGKYYRHMWRYGGLALLAIVVLNSYWLISVAMGKTPINQAIDSIGNRDLSAFTTAAHPHVGLFFNVLSMYGFWLERFGRYAMPNHNRVIWFGGFVLIAMLVLIGIRQRRRARSLLGVSLGIAAVIGLVMALGVQAPVTGHLVRWVITHVPFMRGFREPEKFSALLVLAYAYFAAYGLDRVLSKIKPAAEGRLELLRDGALLLPIIYVSTMPLGFVNQLKPVQYPASWYSFNQQLQQHPTSGKVLFLPWHQYMSYDFTPRVIANPAPNFFKADIIAGTDSEFGGVTDPTPTTTSIFIEKQVLAHAYRTNLGSTLAKLNVQYVLLAHGYDYAQYGFLDRQTDLKLISSKPGLDVYLNKAYHHG